MPDGTPLPNTTFPDRAATAQARPLLDRQLERLDRLADAGLAMAEALTDQARGTGPEVVEGDVALAYDRVSRAVRQATLLQSRLTREAEAQATAAPQARADAQALADKAREERQDVRKGRVSRIVERVVRAEHDDEAAVDRLMREADDRLDDDTLYGDVLSRPASEIVADICGALGLAPDWIRLAEEAWAQEEIGGAEVGWPFMALRPPRALPPLAGGESDRGADRSERALRRETG